MKNILIHGLGQNSKDWDTIKNELETRGISSVAPDLFDLAKGRKLDYPTVYQAFSELCESCNCNNYNPYQYGEQPRFRDEKANWF